MTNSTAVSGNTLGLVIMGDNRIGMFHKDCPTVVRATEPDKFVRQCNITLGLAGGALDVVLALAHGLLLSCKEIAAARPVRTAHAD